MNFIIYQLYFLKKRTKRNPTLRLITCVTLVRKGEIMYKNLKPLLIMSIMFSTILGSSACPSCDHEIGEKKARHGLKKHEKGHFKEKKSNHLAGKLNLTEEQKAKVDSILEAKHKERKAIFENVHPKMEALRKSTDKEIRAILTPEQQEKFDKISEKREEKIKEWKSKFEDEDKDN